MFQKKNNSLVCLAGISAAIIAVLSAGGYLLHRKVLKRCLQEQARKQAMNLAMFDYDDEDGLFDDEGFYKYDDNDEADGDDYITTLMQDLKGENEE